VLLVPFAAAVACGGATLQGGSGEGRDADVAHDAGAKPDVAKRVDANTGDASCVEPTGGASCDPGVSQACGQGGDPCCLDFVWECVPTCNGGGCAGGTWEQVDNGLGCACVIAVDAGAPIDAASPPDAGADAGPDPCGGCSASEICVVTTSSGGACEQPGDGGVCPNGQVVDPDSCCDNSSTSASCEPRPGACIKSSLPCGCAASLCSCMCLSASESTVQCACDYP